MTGLPPPVPITNNQTDNQISASSTLPTSGSGLTPSWLHMVAQQAAQSAIAQALALQPSVVPQAPSPSTLHPTPTVQLSQAPVPPTLHHQAAAPATNTSNPPHSGGAAAGFITCINKYFIITYIIPLISSFGPDGSL